MELDDDSRRLLGFADSMVAHHIGLDPQATLAATETVISLASAVGDGRYLVFSQVCAALCHRRFGRRALALSGMRAAVEQAEQLSNPYLRVYSQIALASVLADAGASPAELDEADALAQGIAAAPAIPAPYPGWARVIQARIMLLRANPDAAVAEASEALRLLVGAPRMQCRAWLTVAAAHREAGRLERAREAADAALERIEAEGGWEHLQALEACARLRAEVGDEAGAALARRELDRRGEELLARIDDPQQRAAPEALLGIQAQGPM